MLKPSTTTAIAVIHCCGAFLIMKVSIKLEYRDKTYISDCTEMTEDEYNQTAELIEKIVEGKVTYFSLKKDNEKFYFGQKILQESIVSFKRHIV